MQRATQMSLNVCRIYNRVPRRQFTCWSTCSAQLASGERYGHRPPSSWIGSRWLPVMVGWPVPRGHTQRIPSSLYRAGRISDWRSGRRPLAATPAGIHVPGQTMRCYRRKGSWNGSAEIRPRYMIESRAGQEELRALKQHPRVNGVQNFHVKVPPVKCHGN